MVDFIVDLLISAHGVYLFLARRCRIVRCRILHVYRHFVQYYFGCKVKLFFRYNGQKQKLISRFFFRVGIRFK